MLSFSICLAFAGLVRAATTTNHEIKELTEALTHDELNQLDMKRIYQSGELADGLNANKVAILQHLSGGEEINNCARTCQNNNNFHYNDRALARIFNNAYFHQRLALNHYSVEQTARRLALSQCLQNCPSPSPMQCQIAEQQHQLCQVLAIHNRYLNSRPASALSLSQCRDAELQHNQCQLLNAS